MIEAEIRAKRQALSKMEEEVKIAEAEVEAGEGRMRDAEERLGEMRAKAAKREAELGQRQAAASRAMESRSAKEALLRMKQAEVSQSLARSPSSDTANMKVAMRPSIASSSKMTLARDCRVYDKPGAAGKVIGSKKAGSSVQPHSSGAWIGFKTKKAGTVYLSKGCF